MGNEMNIKGGAGGAKEILAQQPEVDMQRMEEHQKNIKESAGNKEKAASTLKTTSKVLSTVNAMGGAEVPVLGTILTIAQIGTQVAGDGFTIAAEAEKGNTEGAVMASISGAANVSTSAQSTIKGQKDAPGGGEGDDGGGTEAA